MNLLFKHPVNAKILEDLRFKSCSAVEFINFACIFLVQDMFKTVFFFNEFYHGSIRHHKNTISGILVLPEDSWDLHCLESS